MSIERMGFVDLTGRTFGTVAVDRFLGRNPVVRYEVSCTKCASRWTELHHKLTDAGQGYKCRNVSCQLNRIEQPRKAIEPETVPVAFPVAVPKGSDYQRYANQMKAWGFGNKDIGTEMEWNRLSKERKAKLLAPVIEQEKVVLEKRELEAFGMAYEELHHEEFRRKHGEF